MSPRNRRVRYRKGRLSSSLYLNAATYAAAGSCGETSMQFTVAHSGMSGGVTSCQLAPSSRETCTSPSSEPVHITPGSCGDSTKEKIVQ